MRTSCVDHTKGWRATLWSTRGRVRAPRQDGLALRAERVRSGATTLIGYTGGTSTQCTLQNGISGAGGQVAYGLCLGEANFVCFWQYIGNDRAFNRCVNQRVAACQIGTDRWSAPVCN